MVITVTFQVRVGIPGSLTIEVSPTEFLQFRTPPLLVSPLRQPVIGDDPQAFNKPWAQGWMNPMTQRLIALGGNYPFQILAFESPSLDQTDNAWGASGTINALADPVTFVATPFGASIFGRSFQVGDYVMWDDSSIVGGLYQYEIDQIIAINGTSYTLRRANALSAAGKAQFGSVKGAHAAKNFYQMLDATFFVLWDGTRQVFKFPWDNMIVSAVQATTPLLDPPSLLSLIPIPPDPAVPGLQI